MSRQNKHKTDKTDQAELKESKDSVSASRADRVLAEIRSAIKDGRYAPGERIREALVAEQLNVSRTPVREAFRRLESEGILTYQSWRGVFVSELNNQQVSELYAMREVLEGAAARMAARHIDDAEIDILELLLEQSREAAEDATALASINQKLHETIYQAAHNQYLLQTLEQLANALALLKGTTFEVSGRPATAEQEHAKIIEAIRMRDQDAAEAAARAHIQEAQKARLKLILSQ